MQTKYSEYICSSGVAREIDILYHICVKLSFSDWSILKNHQNWSKFLALPASKFIRKSQNSKSPKIIDRGPHPKFLTDWWTYAYNHRLVRNFGWEPPGRRFEGSSNFVIFYFFNFSNLKSGVWARSVLKRCEKICGFYFWFDSMFEHFFVFCWLIQRIIAIWAA